MPDGVQLGSVNPEELESPPAVDPVEPPDAPEELPDAGFGVMEKRLRVAEATPFRFGPAFARAASTCACASCTRASRMSSAGDCFCARSINVLSCASSKDFHHF